MNQNNVSEFSDISTHGLLFQGSALAINAVVHQYSLTINNYAPKNDGEYRCAATNSQGDHFKQKWFEKQHQIHKTK
jgi:hypothetical protein